MRLQHLLGAVIALFVMIGLAHAADKGIALKTGDTAYVCGCGEKCGCESISKKAGKCNCGHDLSKVTVTKVEAKKAYYKAGDKERSVKLEGKYQCDCGGDCCQYTSQKAGKCPCGKPLAAAKETAKETPKETAKDK